MDYKQIQSLIRQFEKSSLTVLEIESNGFKLKCSKQEQQSTVTLSEPIEEKKVEGFEVKSPLVGTFYTASGPKAKPFVAEGQTINAGDPVCIIEAMKTMNEITSPVAGTVKKILVKNEEAVGFDQVLMIIV